MRKKLYLIPLLCLFIFPLQAQLYMDTTITAEQMVMDFFDGNCVSVTNVTYTGESQAAGYFEAANTELGITGGILLSTGYATDAFGPNNQGGISGNLSSGGDPDLGNLVSEGVNDAAVLEFDLVSDITDTIYFSYIFASEEYPEYVCSGFNDVFAFFQTGPAPGGGNYVNHNIAMVPDTADPSGLTFTDFPVAINSINAGLVGANGSLFNCTPPEGSLAFSDYYVSPFSNANLLEQFQYDGFTVELLAPLIVQANETYHMKIAIGDVSDNIFDSSIFLGVESLCGESDITPPAEAEFVVEDNNRIDIENFSRYATSYLWDFGNGATSTERYPEFHVYPLAGTYDLTLTTQNFCCSDTLTATIDIAQNMTPDTAICGSDYTLTGASPGAVGDGNWEIVYGDGTLINPHKRNAILSNPTEGYNVVVWTIKHYQTGEFISKEAFSIYVEPSPEVNILTESGTSLCITSAPFELEAMPLGGTYGGAGVTTNFFEPFVAGIGAHVITYFYTDVTTGCEGFDEITINVTPAPEIEITTDFTGICSNSPAIELMGTPMGGTFDGTGVTAGMFHPDLVPTNEPITITYTYIDAIGCSGHEQVIIEVPPPPTVDILTDLEDICANASSVELAGIPAGGTFSGPGVVDNRFYPDLAPIGPAEIHYQFSNANGCSGEDQMTIEVLAAPDVEITTDLVEVCANAPAVELMGIPMGGTFSGPGVLGNEFLASNAPIGPTQITYEYLGANACLGQAQITVEVNETPTVQITTELENICADAPAVELMGVPIGGTFSGAGVVGNDFVPNLAPIGSTQLIYQYFGANGCPGQDLMDVEVFPVPASPEILISNDTLICSISADQYIWYLDGNQLSVGGPQIFLTASGAYSVQVVQNGCVSDISSALFLTGLTDLSEQKAAKLLVQPNPASDMIRIQLMENNQASRFDFIRLYNIQGQLLRQVDHETSNDALDLNVSNLPKGVYYIFVETEQENYGTSFVKQ